MRYFSPLRKGVIAAFLTTLLYATSAVKVPAEPSSGGTEDFSNLVNPFIGTTENGNTFPGAALPFGMVQFSPQSSHLTSGSYEYRDNEVHGFSLTHLSGTGCSAAGDIPFLPFVSSITTSPALDTNDKRYGSTFSHRNEFASAGYYRVRLDDGIVVELSATTRTGFARFTYPAGKPATLLIRTSDTRTGSGAAHTELDPRLQRVRGWVLAGNFCGVTSSHTTPPYYRLYFVAYFDRPFARTGTWHNGTVTPNSTRASGGRGFFDTNSNGGILAAGSGGWVTFRLRSNHAVEIRVGISYVSMANAEANLRAENPAGTSFDAVRTKARRIWNQRLSSITITGGTPDDRTIFYTALYHSLVQPNVISDVNGQYPGMDGVVHMIAPGQKAEYSNFTSLWDIYRSQLQLVTLLDPATASDFAESLLNQSRQYSGVWDRTTHIAGAIHAMVGDPADIAIADILAFGGDRFEVRAAYDSLLAAATIPTAADLNNEGSAERPQLDRWEKLHYIPGDPGSSLEFASADFALSELAQRVGDIPNHALFFERSSYWRNLFNPKATPHEGYIATRNADGTWQPFTPTDMYIEDTATIYLWMVPFDERGLINALGGNANASARLDNLFHLDDGTWALKDDSTGLHADFTNEPSLETPWLYTYFGEPYKTQETVRQIITTIWTNTPAGIPGDDNAGNDDMGEMSSWYVWSALGMYPEIPGRSELILASPLFPSIVIHRPQGDIRINAPAAADNAPYVQRLLVDGQPYDRPWLPADFISHGGTLDFTLSSGPNTQWGSAAGDAPPSFEPPVANK